MTASPGGMLRFQAGIGLPMRVAMPGGACARTLDVSGVFPSAARSAPSRIQRASPRAVSSCVAGKACFVRAAIFVPFADKACQQRVTPRLARAQAGPRATHRHDGARRDVDAALGAVVDHAATRGRRRTHRSTVLHHVTSAVRNSTSRREGDAPRLAAAGRAALERRGGRGGQARTRRARSEEVYQHARGVRGAGQRALLGVARRVGGRHDFHGSRRVYRCTGNGMEPRCGAAARLGGEKRPGAMRRMRPPVLLAVTSDARRNAGGKGATLLCPPSLLPVQEPAEGQTLARLAGTEPAHRHCRGIQPPGAQADDAGQHSSKDPLAHASQSQDRLLRTAYACGLGGMPAAWRSMAASASGAPGVCAHDGK